MECVLHGDANEAAALRDTDKPAKMPLAVLEAEIDRLEVAADKETANKLSAVTRRIAEENTALERLTEKLTDHEGARERADALVADREQGYVRVFEALVSEERILNELYAPLMKRLRLAGGTLAKLSFSVTRVANVRVWATRGEDDLFDLRGGPFKGIGSLEREANAMLANAWTTGDAAAVSKAMQALKHSSRRRHSRGPTRRTIARGRVASRSGFTALTISRSSMGFATMASISGSFRPEPEASYSSCCTWRSTMRMTGRSLSINPRKISTRNQSTMNSCPYSWQQSASDR